MCMYKKGIINKFLIVLPFLDLITSLTVRFFPSQTSLGVIIKGLYLLYLLIYLIFNNYSKYKKISIFYLLILVLYELIYFGTKINYLSSSNLFLEFKGQLKFLFFPITLIALLCFYDQFKFSKKEVTNVLTISIISYVGMLIIPIVTGTSFVSGDVNSISKHVGWFYSSEEVVAVLILLYPFLYTLNGKVKNILFYLFSLIVLLILYFIGTPISFFIIFIISMLMFLFDLKQKRKQKAINSFIVLTISTILLLGGLLVSFENNNIYIDDKHQLNDIEREELMELTKKNKLYQVYYNYSDKLLNDRTIYFERATYNYVKNYNLNIFLTGLGLTNENGYNALVGIDIIDLYLYYGFFAIIIYILPIFYFAYLFMKNKKTSSLVFNSIMIMIGYLISTIFGHVLIAPAVSIYLAFYFILFLSDCNFFNKKEIMQKEVSIYVLCLNHGYLEQNVINFANVLSKTYNVKICSVYKLCEPDFKLNKNIKIEYLNENLTLNNNKLEKITSKRKLVKLFQSCFEAIKTAYIKHSSLCKSLTKCNSEIIISTRVEFSKKLVKYNPYDNIKIAHEYFYHNHNIFYLNSIRKILKHVDYLMPCNEYLTEYYKKLYSDYSDKIIQNKMIIDIKGSLNKLDNKNIISVVGMGSEKVFLDLIKVFKLVSEKHPDWLFTIVGSGNEMSKIKKIVKKYNLQNKVIFTGNVNRENLARLYKSSSIYVMPPYEELFNTSLIEAANFNLPLVAMSSSLGAKEIIGEDGIIIEDQNFETMANEINKLIDDYSYRIKIGNNSNLIAQKYDYNSIEQEIISFYDDIGKYSIYSNLYRGTLKDFRKLVKKRLEKKEKTFIITANSETFLLTKKDNVINKVVNDKNNYVVPDGISVVKTANYLGIDITERITGVDLMEYLLETANKYRYSIYLFGSTAEVIKAASEKVLLNYPNIKLFGYENGYVKDKDAVMDKIKKLKPDIVLVALGIPRQEKLIDTHINDFEKGVFIGVGGSFDVISGYKKRAPKIFIKLNLEWLYRILSEPKRITRFLKYNIMFLFHINREKKQ